MNTIIHPSTKQVYNLYSKQGKQLLKHFIVSYNNLKKTGGIIRGSITNNINLNGGAAAVEHTEEYYQEQAALPLMRQEAQNEWAEQFGDDFNHMPFEVNENVDIYLDDDGEDGWFRARIYYIYEGYKTAILQFDDPDLEDMEVPLVELRKITVDFEIGDNVEVYTAENKWAKATVTNIGQDDDGDITVNVKWWPVELKEGEAETEENIQAIHTRKML